MKIKVQRESFLNLISKTQGVVEKRDHKKIASNLLLEAENGKLKVFATDLQICLTDEIECECIKPGKAVVNAKSLFEILREMSSGTVSFERKENHWVIIKQGKSTFNIAGLNYDQFPVFPSFSTNNFSKINSKILSDMIGKTIYSVSHDETKQHLNGVLFEKINRGDECFVRMVATDGHRLSLVDRKVGDTSSDLFIPSGVIIPRKGLNELKHLIIDSVDDDIEVAVEGVQLIVQHNKTRLFIRLIEGKYPYYQQLIPEKSPHSLDLDREFLLASLKRVALLSQQESKGVVFTLADGKITITSNNPNVGDAKEEIEVGYTGSKLKMGFNSSYFLDVLTSFNEDQMSFSFKDGESAGVIKPSKDKDYTCIVMPMKVIRFYWVK